MYKTLSAKLIRMCSLNDFCLSVSVSLSPSLPSLSLSLFLLPNSLYLHTLLILNLTLTKLFSSLHIPKCTYRNKVHFWEESWANRDKSLLWPLMEPVNVGAVDNGWEFPTSHSQCCTHRGAAQYNLELLANSVDEEWPTVLSCVLHASTLHFIPHTADDALILITGKKIWDLPRS